MRVGVIGCGLLGAAVARELQLRRARVVIYESTGPGRGTSGTTFAWVNSYDKEPRAYHDLNAAGIRAHADLQAQPASSPPWFFQTGNLVWPFREDDAARLESRGYAVRRLTAREAHALEPDVLPAAADGVLLLPDEGYVLPAVLVARLLGEAVDYGAELRCPVHVDGFESGAGGTHVRFTDGSSDLVDVLVCCAGRWSAELLRRAGHPIPMVDTETRGSKAVGLLASTAPAPVRLGRVLTTPQLNVRPDGGGRLVLQALDLDGDADPAVSLETSSGIGEEFARRLAALFRGGEHVAVDAIRIGRRALPADGLSVAGHVEDGVYVLTTHSGVTLAPLLARLAAAEISGDGEEARLAPYRPQRFV